MRIGGNIAPTDCPEGHCPGWEGFEMGFGLAGGNYGPYLYCPKCYRILDKWQDMDEAIEQAREART
jgi:hypothetical protein